ncbi:tRNA (adenosine(37)-N6)-dimethylallyltransferase MiaA [Fulvitalea axinellae]
MSEKDTLITILGPTASGKTALATKLAALVNGEIISADSRQVYRGMDIGTGKDLDEYEVDGLKIPYHLIDIVEPSYEYNVFEFQKHCLKAYSDICGRGNTPILCGGTGMYIESVMKGYRLVEVPENPELRAFLSTFSNEELVDRLKTLREVHNTTDSVNRDRIIRAIEIESYQKSHPEAVNDFPEINHKIFGIQIERETLKQRITERLKARLANGMVEEVEDLLEKGFTAEQLKFYGLEYKFVTQFATGELNRNDMFQKLNSAIHAFAKRQMTWFRKMEREGRQIHWIDGLRSDNDKLREVLSLCVKN